MYIFDSKIKALKDYKLWNCVLIASATSGRTLKKY